MIVIAFSLSQPLLHYHLERYSRGSFRDSRGFNCPSMRSEYSIVVCSCCMFVCFLRCDKYLPGTGKKNIMLPEKKVGVFFFVFFCNFDTLEKKIKREIIN